MYFSQIKLCIVLNNKELGLTEVHTSLIVTARDKIYQAFRGDIHRTYSSTSIRKIDNKTCDSESQLKCLGSTRKEQKIT
jgi:hypothetical protein